MLEWLQAAWNSTDTLTAGLERVHQGTYHEQAYLETICTTLKKHRADLVERSQRWKEAYEAGIIDVAELKERLASLNGPIARLDIRIAQHMAQLDATRLSTIDLDMLRTRVAQLRPERHQWKEEDDKHMRWILDCLDIQITLAVDAHEKVAYLTSRFIVEADRVRLVVGGVN